MFTFGREHEKKCEAQYVRNPQQVQMLHCVIDAVHDLIEGKGSVGEFAQSLKNAFISGGSGVWENSGKWLRKSSADYPAVLELWPELAAHPKAEVRFRVACFLNEMPSDVFNAVSPILASDKSKRVSEMANARIAEVNE